MEPLLRLVKRQPGNIPRMSLKISIKHNRQTNLNENEHNASSLTWPVLVRVVVIVVVVWW